MKNIFLKIIYKVLAYYGRTVILKYKPTVIAITGSVGKTSTKEAVFQVMKDEFGAKVRKNEGNLNAEIGIPLTILGYKALPNKFLWPIFLILSSFRLNQKNYPKYLILEMGVENKGDIKNFTKIAKPDIAVITSLSGAHLTNFSSPAEYEKEKLSIITALSEKGRIVLNYDDPILSQMKGDRIASIGVENESADFKADNVKISSTGTEYRISFVGHKIAIKSALLGSQMITSELLAFAVGNLMNIPVLKISKSLERIKPVIGRMNLIEGKGGVKIIDDTYNANPASVKAALLTLGKIDSAGRKVAILGNMNELGSIEKKAHEEIGAFTKQKCDLAIFVGPNAEVMKKGYNDSKSSISFKDRDQLIESLHSIIKNDDLILIKASQNNNFFEEVVKKLMQNSKEADKLLVRQSKFWLNKKQRLSH